MANEITAQKIRKFKGLATFANFLVDGATE